MQKVNVPYGWYSFKKEYITLDTASHQHLSNCYWYARIFFKAIPQNVLETISKRFNGQVLEYRPHSEFTQEINELETMGLLTWVDLGVGQEGVITLDGRVIGKIFTGQ